MGVAIPQVITEDKAGSALVIDGGLRFDSSKSHYLNRTPGSAGNRKTWTWSGWVKKNDTSSQQTLFSAGNSGTNRSNILFDSSVNGALRYFNYASSVNVNLISSQVFRDAAGWYHIVVAFDSTQATEVNRLKFYVNGVQVTNFSTATYPSQNLDVVINNNLAHSIGRAEQASPAEHLSGQLSNVYFIDNQALDPSYFGYTDPLTNTWRPKKLKSGAATVNDGRTWSSNYGNLRTAGTQTNPFDADNTNYAQVSVGGGGYFTFPDGLNGRLEVLASTGQSSDGASTQTVTISNNSGAVASRTTSKGYNTGPEAIDFGVVSGITSVFLTDSGLFWGFRINSITLRDGVTETIGFGTNGFYLPFDGNSPIGQDMSGRGNNWTPVNFGGSNTIEKATGALPILNTDGGGKVARVGVRTDSNASSLVLALPLVGIKSDFSNAINSGTSNKTITANGNATASSAQSNFYGGSFSFDGTGDYLSIPSSSDFAFGTGDFTIEFHSFFAASSLPANATFYSNNYTGTQGVLIQSSSAALYFYVASSSVYTGNVLVAQKWQHIAITRSSGTISIFVDGVLQASGTLSGSAGNSSVGVTIAAGSNGGTGFELNGYLQDIRVYKGVAKYTQNFIPASTDPDILPDTPSGVAYSSNVVLAPTNEGSVSFSSDGSGDYLSLSASADFGFSTPSGNANDFTIEWFQYWTSLTYYQTIWSNNYTSTPGILVQTGNGDGKYRVFVSNGTELFQETNAPAVGVWYHYALVRNGTTYTIYRNGVANGSATSSNAAGSGSDTATIGQGNGSYYLNAIVSNFHVVKGTALYTSNFTPPTAPISSVANTKLLCCKSRTSATVFDVSPGTITANGDAGATNFNPFTVNINTQRGQESGYATFNPLDANSSGTLSNGNLQWANGANDHYSVRSTLSMKTGKWYAEGTVLVNTNSVGSAFGIALRTASLSSYTGNTGSWSYHSNGNKYLNGDSGSSFGIAYGTTVGNVVGLAFDADNGNLDAYCNGVYQGRVVSGLSSDDYFWMVNAYNWTWGINFGQKPFKFPPPAGFQPLALANTPRPTIVRPDQYVGVTTYTGNGGTQSINLGFKPDFVWVKCRTASVYHALFDSVRGTNKRLGSNETSAEQDQSPSGLSSFNSNGFTVVDGSTGGNGVNGSPGGLYAGSTAQYVAWAWKAGGNSNTYNINDIGYSTASAAGLASGTITPTGASVNTKSGFSIITYTGNGSTSSGVTIDHGLGNTPAFVITKKRSGGTDYGWSCWHKDLGGNYGIWLDKTSARNISMWAGYSNFSSTKFTPPDLLYGNESGATYVNYLWAEIPGFSKFGSYTGNSSSDGPVVVTGFRPKWILIKCSSSDQSGNAHWLLFDGERNKFNVSSNVILGNLSDREYTASDGVVGIDILSNGFKIRDNNTSRNGSGTYIYAAFAETPSFNLYGGQANAR